MLSRPRDIYRPSPRFACRWGDNDHYFGPLTFAYDSRWRTFTAMLSSGNDEARFASLRLSAFGGTMLLALPRWLVPTEKKKVFPDNWDAATVQRLGRNWYISQTEREYGFYVSEGHFCLHYGRQTHDSTTEQSKGYFLPWTQWRHVRHSLYGLDGKLFVDLPANYRWGTPAYEEHSRLSDACPTAAFAFKDFDGEPLTATTKIEEREWLLGEKWCRWLSWFAKPKVRRTLDLRFSDETGRRKGSWKGGTMGTGIGMLPGELHASAFQRYCAQNEMTFVGAV